jgi:hypothetical protein
MTSGDKIEKEEITERFNPSPFSITLHPPLHLSLIYLRLN